MLSLIVTRVLSVVTCASHQRTVTVWPSVTVKSDGHISHQLAYYSVTETYSRGAGDLLANDSHCMSGRCRPSLRTLLVIDAS